MERMRNEASEAHHSAQNSFQRAISYLRLLLIEGTTIDQPTVQKLTGFIHSLSTLHGIIFEQIDRDLLGEEVEVGALISELAGFHNLSEVKRVADDLCYVPFTLAGTIGLIVNELITDALAGNLGLFDITLRFQKLGSVTLRTERSYRDLKAKGELKFIESILRSDERFVLTFGDVDGAHSTTLEFPLSSL